MYPERVSGRAVSVLDFRPGGSEFEPRAGFLLALFHLKDQYQSCAVRIPKITLHMQNSHIHAASRCENTRLRNICVPKIFVYAAPLLYAFSAGFVDVFVCFLASFGAKTHVFAVRLNETKQKEFESDGH